MGSLKSTEQYLEDVFNKLPLNRVKFDYREAHYTKAKNSIKIICKECGVPFKQEASSHLRGVGCPLCSKKSSVKKITLNTESYLKRLFERHPRNKLDFNYDLFSYSKSIHKSLIKCTKCRQLFSQTPNDHYSGSGCANCANRCRTPNSFIREVLEKFPTNEQHYDYTESTYCHIDKDIKIGCKSCLKPFYQTPYKHLKGRGCTNCLGSSGYKKLYQGTLYLTKFEGKGIEFLKVGITNATPLSRCSTQLSNSSLEVSEFTILESFTFKDGAIAYNLEKAVKEKFKSSSKYITKEVFTDGYTETFPIDIYTDILEYVKELINVKEQSQ
jgi:ferredoxin